MRTRIQQYQNEARRWVSDWRNNPNCSSTPHHSAASLPFQVSQDFQVLASSMSGFMSLTVRRGTSDASSAPSPSNSLDAPPSPNIYGRSSSAILLQGSEHAARVRRAVGSKSTATERGISRRAVLNTSRQLRYTVAEILRRSTCACHGRTDDAFRPRQKWPVTATRERRSWRQPQHCSQCGRRKGRPLMGIALRESGHPRLRVLTEKDISNLSRMGAIYFDLVLSGLGTRSTVLSRITLPGWSNTAV